MKLKVIVIHRPYDHFQSAEVQSLFCKSIALRLRGYGKEYPYGVTPLDQYDLIGSHVLFCKETKGGLDPVLSFRILRSDLCEQFNKPFPTQTLCEELELNGHLAVVKRVLGQYKRVTFDTGFVIDPEVRQNKDEVNFLRDMMNGIFVRYHIETQTEVPIVLATVKFKIENMFNMFGHKKLEHEGTILPSFKVPSYFGIEVNMMMSETGWSTEAKAIAARFDSYWNNRIEYGQLERPIADLQAA